MKVRITTACKGAPDGITIIHYEAGQEYDLPEGMVQSFVAMGWVAPENAAIQSMPERKRRK